MNYPYSLDEPLYGDKMLDAYAMTFMRTLYKLELEENAPDVSLYHSCPSCEG